MFARLFNSKVQSALVLPTVANSTRTSSACLRGLSTDLDTQQLFPRFGYRFGIPDSICVHSLVPGTSSSCARPMQTLHPVFRIESSGMPVRAIIQAQIMKQGAHLHAWLGCLRAAAAGSSGGLPRCRPLTHALHLLLCVTKHCPLHMLTMAHSMFSHA